MTAAKSEYRTDIDGLRAVAIVPVLLYHFGLGCPGGYVGVDVFFVISGYLISALILRELSENRFSIIDFWERRVRRIFPAAAVVVVGVLAAGWICFEPTDYANLGNSVAAQSALVANFYFWRTTGYFFGGADELPLLHTWSLAVEEQFYLFLPVLLLVISKSGRTRLLLPILAGIGSLSFAASIYGVRYHPEGAFYLLPARAWELLLGAILNVIPREQAPRNGKAEAMAWFGISAIVAAIVVYKSDTPFPGLSALLPCLGAALVIWSNSETLTWVGRVLSVRPVVFVGLISYSLYLWHWPFVVFAKYMENFSPSYEARLGVLAGSFLLAIISWKFVETPIRKRRVFKTRNRVFALYALLTVGFVVSGLLINRAKGISSRFGPNALRYFASRNDFALRYSLTLEGAQKGDFEKLGPTRANPQIELLVWGDSHAMSVLPVLDIMCRQYDVGGAAATHGATAPLLDFLSDGDYSLHQESPAYNRAVLRFVVNHHIRKVLLAARWDLYVTGDSTEKQRADFNSDLSKTLAALREAGAKVYILLTVPTPGFNVPRALGRASLNASDRKSLRMSVGSQAKRNAFEHRLFGGETEREAVVLDPIPYFLEPDNFYGIEREEWALYADNNHLTVHGALLLTPLFKAMFED